MRFALLSSASTAALMLLAAPAAFADADFTGVAEIYLGTSTTDGSFFAGKVLDDPFIYGGKAKGYWPLSPDIHFQGDLFIEQMDSVVKSWTSNGDDEATMFGAAAHLLHPFEDRARFGVAGSMWSNDAFLPADSGLKDATYALGALEAQVFGKDWTVMAQAGLFSEVNCDDGGEGCPGIWDNGTYVRGKISYFLHDNTVLSLETTQMWGNLVEDGFFGGKSVTGTFSNWVFEAEHRFRDSPFAAAITLSHERTQADVFFSSSADTNVGLFTLKYYYGEPSLRSNDRSGAELDTPTFGNSPETVGILFVGGAP